MEDKKVELKKKSQFCDVLEMMIIHKMSLLDLATH